MYKFNTIQTPVYHIAIGRGEVKCCCNKLVFVYCCFGVWFVGHSLYPKVCKIDYEMKTMVTLLVPMIGIIIRLLVREVIDYSYSN